MKCRDCAFISLGKYIGEAIFLVFGALLGYGTRKVSRNGIHTAHASETVVQSADMVKSVVRENKENTSYLHRSIIATD